MSAERTRSSGSQEMLFDGLTEWCGSSWRILWDKGKAENTLSLLSLGSHPSRKYWKWVWTTEKEEPSTQSVGIGSVEHLC